MSKESKTSEAAPGSKLRVKNIKEIPTVFTLGKEYVVSRETKEWYYFEKDDLGREDYGGWFKGSFEPVESAPDEIERPSWYVGAGIEAIEVMEAFQLNYHLGSVCKYLLRAGRKPRNAKVKDLKKARWFLNRYIVLIEDPE